MDIAKKTVLLVEDDEFLRTLAAKRLDKDGYGVAVAVDGDSAFNVAKETKPNLIVLDLLLPGQDGFEVLQKIKSDDSLKAIPVIVFSNLGQKEDIDRANYLGAASFLVKSNFTLDDLLEKVREQLAKN